MYLVIKGRNEAVKNMQLDADRNTWLIGRESSCDIVLNSSQISRRHAKIICENKQIVCAFTGHTHRDNTVILSDEWRNMPVFYCGDFSYNLARDREKNWGYRTLDFKEGVFSTEYVRCLQKD